jgi:gentisate 1,2-dioxygenase
MAVETNVELTPMEQLYQELEAKSMGALWRARFPEPRAGESLAAYAPMVWRWKDVEPFARRALDLVKPGRGEGERRAVTLNNPHTGGRGATHSLTAALQCVNPGDISPSHRHVAAAIRFIIQGEGTVTIVNGEPAPMRPGDLVLTPSLYWHGHVSEGPGPMMWMDSLDAPLVGLLRAGNGIPQQPYSDEIEPATKRVGESYSRYGAGHLRPVWDRGQNTAPNVSPLLSFPWAQTEKALHEMAQVEVSPFDDVAFEYTNPLTGGPVLPTIGCRIQMLRPGTRTKAHRHSASQVYHVFRGEGAIVVDGVRIDWKQGDFFALAPWCWHEWINTSGSEEAVLFSTTDTPVLTPMNLYFEHEYEENGGHQKETATYEERYGTMDGYPEPLARGGRPGM